MLKINGMPLDINEEELIEKIKDSQIEELQEYKNMAKTIDEVDEATRKHRIAAFASALISIHCTKNIKEDNKVVEKCMGWVNKI